MEDYKPGPSSFAFEVEWVSIDDVPKNMAFDHNIILNKGIEFLRNQMNNEFISKLLPRKFTLSQLQNLHEIILNQKLDKRNFRKNILKVENIKRTDNLGIQGPVPEYAILNLSTNYKFNEKTKLYISGKNITDESYIGSRLHSNPGQKEAGLSSGIIIGPRRQINIGLEYNF